MRFKNSAKHIDRPEASWVKGWIGNYYSFNRPSPYLLVWERLFQTVVSQAGTKLLSGKFHTSQTGIYKCEGGCNIAGVDDLVLMRDYCKFDWCKQLKVSQQKQLEQLTQLISAIVLEWDPNSPVDSMLQSAANFIKVPVEELKSAIEKTNPHNPFTGDPLRYFFEGLSVDREYIRFSQIKFNNKTDAEVDQQFTDEDLAQELLKGLQESRRPMDIPHMFCIPKRDDTGLKFEVDRISSLVTEEDLRKIIKDNNERQLQKAPA